MPRLRTRLVIATALAGIVLSPERSVAQTAARGVKPSHGDEPGVLNPRPTKPFPHLRLILASASGGAPVQSAETDASGRFAFANVAPGSYVIRREKLVHRDLATRAAAATTETDSAAVPSIALAPSRDYAVGGATTAEARPARQSDVTVVVAQVTTVTGEVSGDVGPIKGAVIKGGRPTARPPQ